MSTATNFWDELAIESYKTILKKSPDSALIHNNLGLAYRRTNQPAKAIKAFQKAVKCDPGYAEANYHLGTMLQATGDIAGAIKAFGVYNKAKAAQKEGTPIVAELLTKLSLE